jgi:putative endonuclease
MVGREPWIAVYIMADHYRGTLYIGVTSAFHTRMIQHREGVFPGFTRRYGLGRLVWFELHDLMTEAIQRAVPEGMAATMEDQPDRTGQSAVG